MLFVQFLQFFFSFERYFKIVLRFFLVFSHLCLQRPILWFQFYVIFFDYFLHTLTFFQYWIKFLYFLFFICNWTFLYFAQVSVMSDFLYLFCSIFFVFEFWISFWYLPFSYFDGFVNLWKTVASCLYFLFWLALLLVAASRAL